MPLGNRLARCFGPVFEDKRHVLEEREHAEIHEDAEADEDAADDDVFRRLEAQAEKVIESAGGGAQRQVNHVPLGVEKIVRE